MGCKLKPARSPSIPVSMPVWSTKPSPPLDTSLSCTQLVLNSDFYILETLIHWAFFLIFCKFNSTVTHTCRKILFSMPLANMLHSLKCGIINTSHGQMALRMKIKWYKFSEVGVLKIIHLCINFIFLLF